MKAPHAPATPARLFLYGSLLTGGGGHLLHRRLKRFLRDATPAVIRARLYDLGAYPGAVTSTSPWDRVHGLLITLDDSHLLQRIDRYEDYFPHDLEGSEFIRAMVRVQRRGSRRPIRCWVYLYNGDVSDKPRIPGGNYKKFRVR